MNEMIASTYIIHNNVLEVKQEVSYICLLFKFLLSILYTRLYKHWTPLFLNKYVMVIKLIPSSIISLSGFCLIRPVLPKVDLNVARS